MASGSRDMPRMPSRFLASLRRSLSSDLLLRERLVAAVGRHGLQLAQASEAPLDGGEVGEQATQPALVDVKHAAALRLFGNGVLRLTLGADEQHGAALAGEIGDEVERLAIETSRATKVDDVDAVPLAEDVGLHLRIPPFGLVAEVDAGLQEVLHRDRIQALYSPWRSGRPAACFNVC
jgi:hypothetical protein